MPPDALAGAAAPRRLPPLADWFFLAVALRLDRDGADDLPFGRDAPDRPAARLVAVVTVGTRLLPDGPVPWDTDRGAYPTVQPTIGRGFQRRSGDPGGHPGAGPRPARATLPHRRLRPAAAGPGSRSRPPVPPPVAVQLR